MMLTYLFYTGQDLQTEEAYLANNWPEDLMDIQTLNEITEEEFDARLAVVYSSSDEEWMEDFDKYLNPSIPAQIEDEKLNNLLDWTATFKY